MQSIVTRGQWHQKIYLWPRLLVILSLNNNGGSKIRSSSPHRLLQVEAVVVLTAVKAVILTKVKANEV